MSKNKYNDDIYTMYEKEVLKNQKITSKYDKLRWEVEELRYDNKKLNNELSNINSIKEKEINKEVEKIVTSDVLVLKNFLTYFLDQGHEIIIDGSNDLLTRFDHQNIYYITK